MAKRKTFERNLFRKMWGFSDFLNVTKSTIFTCLSSTAGRCSSLYPLKTWLTSQLLSVFPGVLWGDDDSFAPEFHKMPARQTNSVWTESESQYSTRLKRLNSPCFPPYCKRDSMGRPRRENISQVRWETRDLFSSWTKTTQGAVCRKGWYLVLISLCNIRFSRKVCSPKRLFSRKLPS